MLFVDRVDAGRRLAVRLEAYRGAADTVVLGIPRGGIVVGRAIADSLDLRLGICPVRKLGAPGNPELAIGAVDDEAGTIVDHELVRRLGVSEQDLEGEVRRQRNRLQSWVAQFGRDTIGAKPGGQVIVTDDGIATGSTARAAIQSVRRRGPRRVVLAVPVAPRESVEPLRQAVDEWICLATPDPFYAVGNFFETWPQVTDAEVLSLLGTRSVEE